jgi:uncharacterized Zn finger protein
MKSIPSLAEEDIRHFIGEQSFLKGLQYFQNGAILHPVRQGMTLKAYCYGSLPDKERALARRKLRGFNPSR